MLVRSINSPARHCSFVVALYALLFLAFFSPAIFYNHLLAVGYDGLNFYLPNYYSHKVLWDPLLLSGFPMMADPQAMTWYPPAALLSLLPGTWNFFMLLAYVLGSSFMYGYVFSFTRSRFAAFVSGLVFGLSGFMIAHLVHAVIIQSVAWIPLIIWSLEILRHKTTVKWLVIGSLAVALSFLGGHPQIFFYGLILSGAYAIAFAWHAPAGRWRYLGAALLVAMLGIGLAAIQLLPTAELAHQGLQGKYAFSEFVAFGLPPRHVLTMIFPYSFGGLREAGMLSYFGAPNQNELTGYVGLLPLILAALGIIAARHRSIVVFWICVALLAFALAIGDATPLGRLIYHAPILNSFRAPGRHLLEVTISLSVLSGLGVAAIVKQQVSAKMMRRVIALACAAMVACFVLLLLNSGYSSALAAQHYISELSLRPWANRAVGIPLVVFVLAVAGLIIWPKQPASLSRRVLLLIILVIDLGSFGWFFEWRYASLNGSSLAKPASVGRYEESLDVTNQRLMPYRTWHAMTEMTPNLTRLWGVPSAGGYNVLVPRRTRELVPTVDDLRIPLPWKEPNDKSLDVMAVRYVFIPPEEVTADSRGITWLQDDMQQWLGSGCNQPARRNAMKFSLPTPVRSTSLAIVSRLACSTQVLDQAALARVKVIDSSGQEQTRDLLAGRDSSEWAYDCAGVKSQVQHKRAQIFSSYAAETNTQPCEGHRYLTKFSWEGQREIQRIEFDWLGREPESVIIDKLSLLNEETKISIPVDLASANDRGWRLIETTATARVFENLRAMPRAWLTAETVTLDARSALQTIKTGRLPSGDEFDPARIALIEEPASLATTANGQKATATITSFSNTGMEVRTSSSAAGFLLTSDVYYPGWQASIDGRDTKLYRADYALRGVIVPAGEHTVQFVYRPRSFYFGAAITTLSIFVLGALCLSHLRRLRKR